MSASTHSFSSFKKFPSKKPSSNVVSSFSLPGIRCSPFHSQIPICSSGIPELDTFLLPGGLPLGSFTVSIHSQSAYNLFNSVITKIIAAQGIYDRQHVFFLASATSTSSIHFSNVWPSKVSLSSDEKSSTDVNQQDKEKMKIAWRYASQSTTTTPTMSFYSVPSQSFSSHFDLSRPLSSHLEVLKDNFNNVIYYSLFDKLTSYKNDDIFEFVLEELTRWLESQRALPTRVIIDDFLSPVWFCQHINDKIQFERSAIRFITQLKSLQTRYDKCIIWISVSQSILDSWKGLMETLYHLADILFTVVDHSFTLSSSIGNKTEETGILRLLKSISLPNCLSTWLPSNNTYWWIKKQKRKLWIEYFSLPPEDADESESQATSSFGCHSNASVNPEENCRKPHSFKKDNISASTKGPKKPSGTLDF